MREFHPKRLIPEAEALSKNAPAMIAAADKQLQAAATKARETDTRFATFSAPVTGRLGLAEP